MLAFLWTVRVLLVLGFGNGRVAASNGFDRPAMGFNTCNVACGNDTYPNAEFVLEIATQMVQKGFANAGYKYLNMDDGWSEKPRPDGSQVPDPTKFPKGLSQLVNSVHALNLSFGLYTALATNTCGQKAGSCNHEVENALQYAKWGVDYLKDDGCGGCHEDAADPALESYRVMQQGLTRSGRHIFFSTEAGPNVSAMSARPDLYGNTHRSGHDAEPEWHSVMSQYDIASGLWQFAHNDSGHGGFFNDMDLLQIGQGDFRTDQDFNKVVAHFTMHVMLKSTLLLSTVIENLPDRVVAMLTNPEVLAIHQDSLARQARRVSSTATSSNMTPPFSSQMVLQKCEVGNLLQLWRLGPTGEGVNGSAPRLWTQDASGMKWCVGQSSWSRPAELLPCHDARFQPQSFDPAGRDPHVNKSCAAGGYMSWPNTELPVCHWIDTFSESAPACEAGVPEPKYCAAPKLGGMVGEGSGCGLKLECAAGGRIAKVLWADWGLPSPKKKIADCSFHSASNCSAGVAKTVAWIERRCLGKQMCKFTTTELNHGLGDPCKGHNKRVAIAAVGCTPVAQPPSHLPYIFRFNPGLQWDNSVGGSGPIPHSRYIGGSAMCETTQVLDGDMIHTSADGWYWGDLPSSSSSGSVPTARTLHPSSVLWEEKGNGIIIDNDNIGGPLQKRLGAEWCATGVNGGNLEVWHAELKHERHAIALLNRSPKAEVILAHWKQLGFALDHEMAVRDVWNDRDLGILKGQVSELVPSYGVVLLVMDPFPIKEKTLVSI